MNVRRITLAYFPLIFTTISVRPREKLVRYVFPIFIVLKSIHLFTLSSGGKPACPHLCGVELFTPTPTLLLRLERYQSGFLTKHFLYS